MDLQSDRRLKEIRAEKELCVTIQLVQKRLRSGIGRHLMAAEVKVVLHRAGSKTELV